MKSLVEEMLTLTRADNMPFHGGDGGRSRSPTSRRTAYWPLSRWPLRRESP